jgi:uncharacterized protein (DUF1684 family)
MGKVLTLLVGCALWAMSGCTQKPTTQELSDHRKEVDTWFEKRVADLKGHDGWLNVAGLFWLRDGINSFGSDSTNDIVFPSAITKGYFMLRARQVTMITSPGPGSRETVIFHPDSTNATRNHAGSLEWFVIRRGNKFGIRLRDFESDNVKNFKGIERYPVDYSWRIPAKFETAKGGETIDITNVLGQTTATPLAGTLVFDVNNKEQRLAATAEDGKLFIVFGDATNGKETYGAGRFIYVNRPDSTGNVIIDFNKSYNPPCAFTEFATCPLPPRRNVLSVSIPAGEKNYSLHGK